MDNLQYIFGGSKNEWEFSFKPCYKWIIFNIDITVTFTDNSRGFKPCYKWIIFNINVFKNCVYWNYSFKPCYKWIIFNIETERQKRIQAARVLNLVING